MNNKICERRTEMGRTMIITNCVLVKEKKTFSAEVHFVCYEEGAGKRTFAVEE